MKIKQAFTKQDELEFMKGEYLANKVYLRKMFLLFIFLYALFGITDRIYFPDGWKLLYVIRFGIVIPVFIVAIILSFSKKFLKYQQRYVALSFFVGGIGIAYMLILSPENIIYYGGLLMIYFSGYFLIKLRFFYASSVGLSIFIFHILGYIISNNSISNTFLYGAFFFIGANLIGMAGAYNIEMMNRKRFLHEKEIAQINEKLQLNYDEKVEQFNRLEQSIKENKALNVKNKELDQLTKSLEESEQHHKLVLNSTASGIYEVNLDDICTYINENALRLLGYQDKNEVLGKKMHELVHHSHEDGTSHQAKDCFLLDSFLTSAIVNKDDIIWKKDGTYLHVSYASSPQLKDGKIVGVVVTFSDISERKQHEMIQKQSDERYRLLFETMAQGVVYHDKDGLITSCNPIAEKVLGLSFAQMQGKTTMDPRWKMIDETGNSISGEDHPAMLALRTKERVGPVVRGVFRPESGDYVWLNIIAIPLFLEGDANPHLVYATFDDITEKIKAGNKVTYLKNLLEYIITNSNQGIAVHDKDLNYVYVSQRYLEMYRVKNKDVIGKHHYQVFPDLPMKWREIHQRALKGEVLKGERDTYQRADGTTDYTRWLCLPWYDEKDEIAGIIIYTEVINDLIETEIELKESYDHLQYIMDRLPIGIAVNSVNPEVNFEYMNDNFAPFYNTTREALEKNDSFWDVVYEDESYRKEIKKKVIEGIKSKDLSRMRWEDVPITQHGEIVKYISAYAIPIPGSETIISTVIDVTERKMKENMIIHTSNHDYLTNLPNRRYFEEMLTQYDAESFYPLMIVMIDVDGLKIINDAFGHQYGNEALIEVARILSKTKRDNDFIARIGGDEFVILCPNTDESAIDAIKHSLFEEVNHSQFRDFNFSLSLGYSVKTNNLMTTTEVLNEAEDNMYSNKVLHGRTARNESVMSILQALKDKYNEERIHSDKVSYYCKSMGEKLGFDEDAVKELELAGLMHDIGKITIPDNILDKPGKLTDEEWKVMKTHTINGYNILRSADKYSRLAEYALTHHERWDGKGYPNGKRGEDIPLFSRIISISDSYEAMTADRPYRKALGKEFAIAELKRCAGSQFDAQLVDVFINEVI